MATVEQMLRTDDEPLSRTGLDSMDSSQSGVKVLARVFRLR